MSTTDSVFDVHDISSMRHREAMAITQVENAPLGDVLAEVDDGDWKRQTDCLGWDVRALAVDLIGSAQASPVEFARRLCAGLALRAEIGGTHWVDGVKEAQWRARADLTTGALPSVADHRLWGRPHRPPEA